MKIDQRAAIRSLLRGSEDGLSTAEICSKLNIEQSAARKAMLSMPDCYIDRWAKNKGPYFAIWCVVTPPENCPHPKGTK